VLGRDGGWTLLWVVCAVRSDDCMHEQQTLDEFIRRHTDKRDMHSLTSGELAS